jgi:hypothetical protein
LIFSMSILCSSTLHSGSGPLSSKTPFSSIFVALFRSLSVSWSRPCWVVSSMFRKLQLRSPSQRMLRTLRCSLSCASEADPYL